MSSYLVNETDGWPYLARTEDEVIRYALEYTREHGPFLGLEGFEEVDVDYWIRQHLASYNTMRLLIPGPRPREYYVRKVGP